jgi:hypothetical protein
MRNLLLTTGLTLLAAVGCDSPPGELNDPPVLRVTSPERSLLQDRAGVVQVTGEVAPNEHSGAPISKVLVNNVEATVRADGSFTAFVDVKPGATLIHTRAIDAAGQEATDTRSVQAGEIRPIGTFVDDALTASLSKKAFERLSAAAGPMLESMDFAPILAPMQPMVHAGDEDGEDCLFGRLYVDDVDMQKANIELTPTYEGLALRAVFDGLDVPARARYAVACADGNTTLRLKANRVVVEGTLVVTPDGNKGFKTELVDENIDITGLDIQASGLPGTIIDLLSLDTAVGYIISIAAPMAMEPMLNNALGGLAGPQELEVLGKKITFQVDPTAVDIHANGALITLSTKVQVAGSENSRGYVFTDNGLPSMNPGQGVKIGLADDLVNQLLSQVTSIGLLNLEIPAQAGSFDATAVEMTSAPMVSADPADGKMKIVLGDALITYTNHGEPVGKAALNAVVELKVVPSASGQDIVLELGQTTAYVDVLGDIENRTRLADDDLARATKVVLEAQITSLTSLLKIIPLPRLGGIVLHNVSLTGDDGYVILEAELQ